MPLEPKAIDPKHLSDIERDLPGVGQGYNTGNLSARYHKDVTALLQDRRTHMLADAGKLKTELESVNRVCQVLEGRNLELRERLEASERENARLRKDIDDMVKEETKMGTGLENL